jgi:hypothetical protein
MSKGAQAMAVAMIRPEPEKRGPKAKGQRIDSKIESIPVDRSMLSQARTVLALKPTLAPLVLADQMSLTDALGLAFAADDPSMKALTCAQKDCAAFGSPEQPSIFSSALLASLRRRFDFAAPMTADQIGRHVSGNCFSWKNFAIIL